MDRVDDMDGFQIFYLFIYFFLCVDFSNVTDVGGSLVWVGWTRRSNANLWCWVASQGYGGVEWLVLWWLWFFVVVVLVVVVVAIVVGVKTQITLL